MSRAEKWALGGAAIGHALLFVGLSLVWKGEQPKELKMSPPIDVSLVDEVALDSTAPAETEAPDQSVVDGDSAQEHSADSCVRTADNRYCRSTATPNNVAVGHWMISMTAAASAIPMATPHRSRA